MARVSSSSESCTPFSLPASPRAAGTGDRRPPYSSQGALTTAPVQETAGNTSDHAHFYAGRARSLLVILLLVGTGQDSGHPVHGELMQQRDI